MSPQSQQVSSHRPIRLRAHGNWDGPFFTVTNVKSPSISKKIKALKGKSVIASICLVRQTICKISSLDCPTAFLHLTTCNYDCPIVTKCETGAGDTPINLFHESHML